MTGQDFINIVNPKVRDLVIKTGAKIYTHQDNPLGLRENPILIGGCYSCTLEYILINDDQIRLYQSPATYHNVLLHELIHWTGAPSRLSRPAIVVVNKTGYLLSLTDIELRKEECIAQYGAYLLAQKFGIYQSECIHFTAQYLQMYSYGGNDYVDEAERAVKYLLEAA